MGRAGESEPVRSTADNYTPVLGRVLLQRHGKRKIWDEPEFHQDFGKKKIRLGDTPLSSKPVSVPRRTILINTCNARVTRASEREKSRIILRFRFHPPPNPVPKSLQKQLKAGRLLNSMENIRTELLFDSPVAPQFVNDPSEEYEAISKRSLNITLRKIRKKINLVHRMNSQSKKCIDLDNKYDELLQKQLPSILDRKSNNATGVETRNVFDDDERDEDIPKKIMEINDFIYIRLNEKIFCVKPPVVVVTKMSDEDIRKFQSLPRGLMLSCALNPYI